MTVLPKVGRQYSLIDNTVVLSRDISEPITAAHLSRDTSKPIAAMNTCSSIASTDVDPV